MTGPIHSHGKAHHTEETKAAQKKGDVSQRFVVSTDLVQLSTSWNEENSANVMARSRMLSKEMNLEEKVTDNKGNVKTVTKTDITASKFVFKNSGYLSRVANNLGPATTLLAHRK